MLETLSTDHYALRQCNFHGCQFGLVSCQKRTKDKPILKPWRVMTNCHSILTALNRKCVWYRLNGTHDGYSLHVPCQGADTQLTENYTDEMVVAIHQAHQLNVDSLPDALAFSS